MHSIIAKYNLANTNKNMQEQFPLPGFLAQILSLVCVLKPKLS